jgi:hypothetical protein
VWALAENKHRWKIQLGAALASNPFLMNFLHGRISRTGLKAVCVPGLNCYSCPAAAASCPIGALQAVIGSSKFQFAWYVVGFLIFAGALLAFTMSFDDFVISYFVSGNGVKNISIVVYNMTYQSDDQCFVNHRDRSHHRGTAFVQSASEV